MQIHSFTKTLKRKTKSILLNLIIDIQYIKSKPKQEKVPKRISMYSNKKTKRWRLLAPEYVFDTGRVPFNTLENSNILSWPPRRAPSPALRAAVLQNMLVHCPHMDVLDLQSSPSHLYHLRCEILLLPPSVVLAGACGHGFGLHSSHAIGPMDRTYRLPRLLLLHQNVRAPLGIRHPLQLRLFEFGRA